MATNINQTLVDLSAILSQLNLDDLAEVLEGCCSRQAGDIELPPSDGSTDIGPGKQFPDEEAYLDFKCLMSNAIWETTYNTVVWLENNRVDLLAGAFGGATTGLIAALLAAGPVGWSIGAVMGAVIAILSAVFYAVGLDLFDMVEAYELEQEDLINVLYSSPNAQSAKADFLQVLEDGATFLSPIEINLAGLMMPTNLLNQLFMPRDTLPEWEPADPIVCEELVCTPTFEIGGTAPSANVSGTPFSFSSEDAPPYDTFGLGILVPEGCPCVNYIITVTASNIIGGPGGSIVDCLGEEPWRYDVQGYGNLIGVPYTGRSIFLLSATEAFSGTMTIVPLP